MRVKLNRNLCDANLAYCERCLGKFLRNPLGYERHCFTEIAQALREQNIATARDVLGRWRGIPADESGRSFPLLRRSDRLSILEPWTRRFHDRAQDALDTGQALGTG